MQELVWCVAKMAFCFALLCKCRLFDGSHFLLWCQENTKKKKNTENTKKPPWSIRQKREYGRWPVFVDSPCPDHMKPQKIFFQSGRIWTRDILFPKQARYQAALHSAFYLFLVFYKKKQENIEKTSRKKWDALFFQKKRQTDKKQRREGAVLQVLNLLSF